MMRTDFGNFQVALQVIQKSVADLGMIEKLMGGGDPIDVKVKQEMSDGSYITVTMIAQKGGE